MVVYVCNNCYLKRNKIKDLDSLDKYVAEWYLIAGPKLIANFQSIWSLVIDRF